MKRKREKRFSFRWFLLRMVCIIGIISGFVVMAWNSYQLVPGFYFMIKYSVYETGQAVGIALLRQLLRFVAVLYGLAVIMQALKVFFTSRKNEVKVKHRHRWAVVIVLSGIVLQILSLSDLYTNICMVICVIIQIVEEILLGEKIWSRRFAVGMLISYVLVYAGILGYSYIYCRNFERKTEIEGVSTQAKANDEIWQQLWQMSANTEFYHASLYDNTKENDYGFITIPGMDYAMSVTVGEKPIADTCTCMTPQGIAVSDKYVYISAYCHNKNHKSVIFIMDRQSGKYIKELVLNEATHAGGLAYDTEHGVLWIATKKNVTENGETHTRAAIACLTDEQIEEYDYEKTGETIKYTNKTEVYVKATSFMTYKDGNIYVGYWESNRAELSLLMSFKVSDNGLSLAEIDRKYAEQNKADKVEEGETIDDSEYLDEVDYEDETENIYDEDKEEQIIDALEQLAENKGNYEEESGPAYIVDNDELKDIEQIVVGEYQENDVETNVPDIDVSGTGKEETTEPDYSNKDEGKTDTQKDDIDDDEINLQEIMHETYYIKGQIQGVAFYDGYILFTVSYGMGESHLEVYKDNGNRDFYNINPLSSINLPQMLEQIYVYGNKIYTIFESASFAYRMSAPICMDHVVTMDANVILDY